MRTHLLALPCAFLLIATLASHASAQETTTYTYDAKGRVTGVTRSGGPSSGVATTYTYDKADNRTNVTVTGSTTTGSSSGTDGGVSTDTRRFVVVPLNGFTIIPVN